MNDDTIISVHNVNQIIDGKHILQDISFNIKRGSSVAIIGKSGNGKSVMLKTLLGKLPPSSGNILIDGCDDQKKNFSKFGMLFQSSALMDSLNIWENIAFGLINGSGIKVSDAKDSAISLLKTVGLKEEVAYQYPDEISGGMQKRAALARTMSMKPEILLLDEPTTGLDPVTSRYIYETILECAREISATVISVTHDIQGFYKVATEAIMINQGSIAWMGHKNEIPNTTNPHLKEFLT